jgi:hypothetical protein
MRESNTMAKKYFAGVKLLLPVTGVSEIASKHFIDAFTSNPRFDFNFIQKIKSKEMSIDQVIDMVMGLKKDDDVIAYSVYEDVVEHLMNNFGKQKKREIVTLRETIDVTRLFDTNEKMDNFLAYFMKHTIENKVKNMSPVIEVMTSYCMDYYYFLRVLEDYMVDVLDADRILAKKYITREFFTYYHMFFLILGVFKLNYSLMNMKISELSFSRKLDNKEVLKSWIPAFYKDENDEIFYMRQIQFSKTSIEKRLKEAEVNNPKSDFNFNLYANFLNVVSKQKIEQLS